MMNWKQEAQDLCCGVNDFEDEVSGCIGTETDADGQRHLSFGSLRANDTLSEGVLEGRYDAKQIVQVAKEVQLAMYYLEEFSGDHWDEDNVEAELEKEQNETWNALMEVVNDASACSGRIEKLLHERKEGRLRRDESSFDCAVDYVLTLVPLLKEEAWKVNQALALYLASAATTEPVRDTILTAASQCPRMAVHLLEPKRRMKESDSLYTRINPKPLDEWRSEAPHLVRLLCRDRAAMIHLRVMLKNLRSPLPHEHSRTPPSVRSSTPAVQLYRDDTAPHSGTALIKHLGANNLSSAFDIGHPSLFSGALSRRARMIYRTERASGLGW